MTEHTAGLAPRITLGMLRGACREQRDIFEAEWPEGADATIENVRRAQELGLNLAWGEHWFRVPARKAYIEARVQAWKAYLEATATAWKVYREALAQAWVAAYLQSVAEREMQRSEQDEDRMDGLHGEPDPVQRCRGSGG